MTDVRVGVVSYNTAALLDRCLASLPAALEGVDAEIVVVDNASTDGSADTAAAHDRVTVVRAADNAGYPRSMNRALAGTDAPVLLALNPDTVAAPGSLAHLARRIVDEPRLGLVSPRLRNADGSVQHSVHRFPSPAVSLASGFVPHGLRAGAIGERFWLEGYADLDRPAFVDWTVGAVHAIRRAAVEDADHPYTERWFMYAEDLDLCWQLHRRGWDVAFDPSVEVVHVGNVAGEATFGSERTARVIGVEYEWYRETHGALATRVWRSANVAGLLTKWAVARASGRRELAAGLERLVAIHRAL
jgi:GT2 family glycosyltransferase